MLNRALQASCLCFIIIHTVGHCITGLMSLMLYLRLEAVGVKGAGEIWGLCLGEAERQRDGVCIGCVCAAL